MLVEDEVRELALFLYDLKVASAQSPNETAIKTARELLRDLQRDLSFDAIVWSLNNGGTDMEALL